MAIKVQGSTIIDDSKRILDGNNNVGTSGSILSATGSGLEWISGGSSDVVDDTSPQLGGDLDGNSKSIYGVGVVTATSFVKDSGTSSQFLKADGSVDSSTYLTSYSETSTLDNVLGRGNISGIGLSVGVVTATSFSGSLATSDLTGTITNAQLAGSIANAKLVNDSVSYGGVSVDLGASDDTPAFDLTDATNYPYTSLTGITTEIVGDTTPQLGGNLDLNSKYITGTGGVNVTGVVTATSFVGNLTGDVTGTASGLSTTISINTSGIITATSFEGDGSALTGISAGGGGGEFNTGITSTVQVTPLSFETTMHTLPSTSGRQYVIESINVANVDESVGVGTTVNIIASIQDATAGEQTYIAYNVPIVTGGVIELLKNPIVAGPSDVIRMWTTNDGYVGVNDAVDVYINYAEHESTDFISKFAATTTINSTSTITLYTSTSNPTMIEKIGFANRTDTGDFPISIKVTSGTTTSYLAKNLIIPRYSTVDILDRPKRIETDAKIEVEAGSTSTIDVIIAGKKITS